MCFSIRKGMIPLYYPCIFDSPQKDTPIHLFMSMSLSSNAVIMMFAIPSQYVSIHLTIYNSRCSSNLTGGREHALQVIYRSGTVTGYDSSLLIITMLYDQHTELGYVQSHSSRYTIHHDWSSSVERKMIEFRLFVIVLTHHFNHFNKITPNRPKHFISQRRLVRGLFLGIFPQDAPRPKCICPFRFGGQDLTFIGTIRLSQSRLCMSHASLLIRLTP